MKTVALIPARGGSKRIKNKNIIDLCGKPLIGYAIEAAQNCDLIDSVWVSTNDPLISVEAKNFGVSVLDRPDALAGDTATSESALLHFAENAAFDILVFMQATSPLTRPEHLTQGIEMVANAQADSCLSVCADTHFYWDSRGYPLNYDLNDRPRSQDIEKRYRETGSFYISKKEALLKSKCRVSGRIGYVVLPLHQSFEIDTYEDLRIVEAIMQSHETKLDSC